MQQPWRPIILRFDSLDSTNAEAARQAMRGAPEGLCVVAREQTAGRGRHGRIWASPAGAGLYFSVVLRPQLEVQAWPLITLTAAVAAADALEEAARVAVDIKWPNDIYAAGRKLCGILAETGETGGGAAAARACVLGIGINLTRDAVPPELREGAVSVEELTGSRPEPEALLRALVGALGSRYAQLHAGDGRLRMLREWTVRSSYAEGKRVRVSLDDEVLEGLTRGLAADGALRVETTRGEIRDVHAGDVTELRGAR